MSAIVIILPIARACDTENSVEQMKRELVALVNAKLCPPPRAMPCLVVDNARAKP